ncbi:hypothetical protein SAMD00019534_115970 [Acytostelium subglobosum LB1]|uniref:hypothetical protein n=1 Tax=Acytostelium subglobosum LB1 TaxID=1410327 RepID=UPI000644F713|nr:hypothetical protein SAMD00019534_115970 [Acytostelium subglobosum LB1]GAM28421.1 hypothetical protein SAMD00019534_115970 [Acytostelium subglobosum LB1]|eukprot:XP_012748738.1 hypothetical protein SAMD00019534_115970 [Acytostelium subglobosum LB1]
MTEVQQQQQSVITPWSCSFMTRDEFNQLSQQPLQIVSRAELKIKQLLQQLETVSAKQSVDSTNAEQLFQQLETNYINCKKDYDTINQDNQRFRDEIQQLSQKNAELLEESHRFRQMSIEKESRANTLGKLYDELHQEKVGLHNIIERKQRELGEETDTVKKLTERLNESIQSKTEQSSKLLTLENEKTSNEYLIRRLKQEIDELKTQNKHMDEVCRKHTQSYYVDLKELKSNLSEMTSKAEQLADENARVRKQMASLQDREDEYEKTIETHLREIKAMKDERAQNLAQFEQELEMQKRLVTLYKEGQEDATKKITTLQSQIDSLKEVDRKLRKEHEDAYKKMEDAYDSLEENYQRVCKEFDEYKTSSDNNNNNAATPDLSQMDVPVLSDPTKRRIQEVTSLGSREDMRRELLDMVVRYDDLAKITLNERRQKRFLQDNLDHVLREVEKKAPIIHEKNREFQRLLKTQEKLLNTYQELQSEKDTLSLKVSTITTENVKLRQEANDLQKQVRNLLKEALDNNKSVAAVQAQSPSLVPEQMRRSSLSSSTLSTSEIDQIIPDSLITFNTIEELQVKNQELLRSVRRLSQEMASHNQNDKKLEMAIQELEMLRSSRERQAEAIQSLVKQRDHYKNLSQQSGLYASDNSISSPVKTMSASSLFGSGSSPFGKQSTGGASKSPNQQQQQHMSASYNSEEDKKEIDRLQKSLRELQHEYEQYTADRKANDRDNMAKIDKLKEENTSFKVSVAQVQGQNNLLEERTKMLTSTYESQKKDVESYREKNNECMQIIVKHQKTLEENRTTISHLQEQTRLLETKVANFKSENEIIKSSELRLIESNKWLSNEKINLENILNTINSMNLSKEGAEQELRRKLENDINSQETSRLAMKKELDDERQANKDNTLNQNHQLNEMRERVEKKEKEVTELKEKVLKSKIVDQTQQQRITSLESQLANAEVRFNALIERSQHQAAGAPSSSSNAASQEASSNNAVTSLDLSLARSEIESLKESLEQEKDNVIHYKSIAVSSESDLTKLKEENTKLQLEFEEKLKEVVEANASLQEQLKEQSVKMEKYEQFSSTHKQDIDLIVAQRDSLTTQKDTLLATINTLQAAQEQAVKEASIQSEMAERATKNYERELMLHAEDIKILPALRNELQEAKHMINSLTSKMESSVGAFEETQRSWLEQETLLKAQITEFEERIKDMKHQNTLLQSQIDTISQQSSKIERMTAFIGQAQSGSMDNTGMDEKEKLIANLRELTQVQAREQKILEVRNESLTQENSRLRQTTQQNQRTIETLTQKLQEQQDHLKNIVFSARKHEEVLKQLDQMNLFRESNIMLKEETNKLQAQLKIAHASHKEMEEKLVPLVQQTRSLERENQVLTGEIEAQRIEISNWSTKVEKLLHKYQSIDPEVHQTLVVQHETLTKENQSHIEQLEEVKKHAKHWKDEAKKAQLVIQTQKHEKTDLETAKKTLEDSLSQQRLQLEAAQQTHGSANETYEKKIEDHKKKQQNLLKMVKESKEKNETLTKTLSEKEKLLKEATDANDMMKSKMKVYEMRSKAPATAQPVSAPTSPLPTPEKQAAAPVPPSTPVAAPALQGAVDSQQSPQQPPIRRQFKKQAAPAMSTFLNKVAPSIFAAASTPATPAPLAATPTPAPATPTPTPSIFSPTLSTASTTPAPAIPAVFVPTPSTVPATSITSTATTQIDSPVMATGGEQQAALEMDSTKTQQQQQQLIVAPTSETDQHTLSPPHTPINDQSMIDSPSQTEEHMSESKEDEEGKDMGDETGVDSSFDTEVQTTHAVKKQRLDVHDSQNTYSDDEGGIEEEENMDVPNEVMEDEDGIVHEEDITSSTDLTTSSSSNADIPAQSETTTTTTTTTTSSSSSSSLAMAQTPSTPSAVQQQQQQTTDTPSSTGKRKLNRNTIAGVVPAMPQFVNITKQPRKSIKSNAAATPGAAATPESTPGASQPDTPAALTDNATTPGGQ